MGTAPIDTAIDQAVDTEECHNTSTPFKPSDSQHHNLSKGRLQRNSKEVVTASISSEEASLLVRNLMNGGKKSPDLAVEAIDTQKN